MSSQVRNAGLASGDDFRQYVGGFVGDLGEGVVELWGGHRTRSQRFEVGHTDFLDGVALAGIFRIRHSCIVPLSFLLEWVTCRGQRSLRCVPGGRAARASNVDVAGSQKARQICFQGWIDDPNPFIYGGLNQQVGQKLILTANIKRHLASICGTATIELFYMIY